MMVKYCTKCYFVIYNKDVLFPQNYTNEENKDNKDTIRQTTPVNCTVNYIDIHILNRGESHLWKQFLSK